MMSNIAFVPAVLSACVLLAQSGTPASVIAIPMPADRADSYAFYSRLMPVGESANKGWPHDLYLVEDTTRQMVAPDKPCNPSRADGKRDYTNYLNPHDSVTPPDSDRQDYEEILADFDAHCHDRVRLDPNAFSVAVPVRLLDAAQQREFQSLRFGAPPKDAHAAAELAAKYKGAPGLYAFSEVYFNTHHTVALVESGVWCGGLCGHWFWSAFRLKDGQWIAIRWNSTITMS